MTTQIAKGNFKQSYRLMTQSGRNWEEEKKVLVAVARALGKEVSDSVFDKRNQKSLYLQKFWKNLKVAIWSMIEKERLKVIEASGPIVGREVMYMGEVGTITNFSGTVVCFLAHSSGRKTTSLSLLNFFHEAYGNLPGEDIEGQEWWIKSTALAKIVEWQ